MEDFVIIVNGWKLLTIITKSSILDIAAVVDPPLNIFPDHANILKWVTKVACTGNEVVLKRYL